MNSNGLLNGSEGIELQFKIIYTNVKLKYITESFSRNDSACRDLKNELVPTPLLSARQMCSIQ
jgi:hypothetical protein